MTRTQDMDREGPTANDARRITDIPRPWTPDELTILRTLAAEGLRVGVIALRLKRSYSSVLKRAQRDGIRFASISARQATSVGTRSD